MRNSLLEFVILLIKLTTMSCTIDHLDLTMPRFAPRGSNVALKCEHSVPPEQLHKVEWRKGGEKIFQYVKGRKPPFRFFAVAGIEINVYNSNERQLELSRVDFATSGSYCCTVSMETPIFTKDSDEKTLTVFEPQTEDPRIEFDKDMYEIGDVLLANCTSSKSRPPPHITWFINDQKVDDAFTRSFPVGPSQGSFEQKAFSTKELSMEVSELNIRNDKTIKFTCVATIPGQVDAIDGYADRRSTTIELDVELTEAPVEAISNSNVMSSGEGLVDPVKLISVSTFLLLSVVELI